MELCREPSSRNDSQPVLDACTVSRDGRKRLIKAYIVAYYEIVMIIAEMPQFLTLLATSLDAGVDSL